MLAPCSQVDLGLWHKAKSGEGIAGAGGSQVKLGLWHKAKGQQLACKKSNQVFLSGLPSLSLPSLHAHMGLVLESP